MISGFFGSLIIGQAILDKRLRFQVVNSALAGMDGLSIESHLNHTVRDVLGSVAPQIESALYRTQRTGRSSLNNVVVGRLPTRSNDGRWLWSYFPILSLRHKVLEVGVVVVEVTPTRKMTEMLLTAFLQEQIRIVANTRTKRNQTAALLGASLSLSTPRSLLEQENRIRFAIEAPTTVTLEQVVREHIIETLRKTHGCIAGPCGAAKILGLKRSTLQSKMLRLHIARVDYI